MAVAIPQRFPAKEDIKNVYVTKEKPSNNNGLGSYRFAYEQSDRQFRDETAEVLKNTRESRSGEEVASLRVTGSFGWIDPKDGKEYNVKYVADESGFHPQGAHLPSA